MQEQPVIDTTEHLASMVERAKMLAGPDYFTCERTHTRIRKADCINRQTEGVRLEGSLKKEIPPECKECPQGRQNIESEKEGMGEGMEEKQDKEQAFEEIKAACEEKECQFWYADGCTYLGRLFKGTCKRKYMREYYKNKKTQRAKSIAQSENKVNAVQEELERPTEEHMEAPSIVLDFEGSEDLYEHLERAARDEVRTPELQALWYVKRSLRDREIIHDQSKG